MRRGWIIGSVLVVLIVAGGVGAWLLWPPAGYDYLSSSWSTYARRIAATDVGCRTVDPVHERPGLLQGYCQSHRGAASADIAAYGEGDGALTLLRAVIQGDPTQLGQWWREIAAVFEPRDRDRAAEWLEDHRGRGGETTIGRLNVRFQDSIVTHEYIVIEVRGRKDGPVTPGASMLDFRYEELAQRFAPVFRFYPGEPFRPLSLEAYLSQTRVCAFVNEIVVPASCADPDKPAPDACGHVAEGKCFLALDVRDAVEDRNPADHRAAERRMRTVDPLPRVYWHVQRVSPSRAIVQYWLFYSYNDYSNLAGTSGNKHEGDWEWVAVDVRADAQGASAPYEVALSAHEESKRRRVAADPAPGWRPVVFVALGSHANYFRVAGAHPVRIKLGSRHVRIGTDRVSADGFVLRPRTEPPSECDYVLGELTGEPPPWRYGAVNVVFKGPVRSVAGRGPEDPRERTIWDVPIRAFDGGTEAGEATEEVGARRIGCG
jgi:hypothetical protein